MTEKPINLNRARKDRARMDRQARAGENAAKFGQTKAERSADDMARDATNRHLDQHKRDE